MSTCVCVWGAGSADGKHQGAAGVFLAPAWTWASCANLIEWKTQFLSIIPSPEKPYLKAAGKFILPSNWPIFVDWWLRFTAMFFFPPHLFIYIFYWVRSPLWWRIVELKSKCRQVDAIDRNTWKCQPQFETIGFCSIYFFIYRPKEHSTTVGTQTKPAHRDGENYPFWKLLRRPNMTPSLVQNTPFPQTCHVVNSNLLLHV